MVEVSIAKKPDPILEFAERSCDYSLIMEDNHPMIASNTKRWIFPGCTVCIDTELEIWIPKGHVGIVIKDESSLKSSLQLDTIIIYDNAVLNIRVTNKGLLPIRITQDTVLAHLLIVPITECYVVNTEGQS